MNVTIVDFYNDITGKSSNTPAAMSALKRWNIPFFTNTKGGSTKKFWKVDVQYTEQAKAAYQAEVTESERRKEARYKPKKAATTNEPIGLMERMAAVEQELRTLNAQFAEFLKRYSL